MRFVSPETVRIDLANGDWIEVKKELTVGEEKRYRSAGMKRVRAEAKADGSDRSTDVEVDWQELALARVLAYLVDWSATKTDDKGKTSAVPVTRKAIEALHGDDFDLIDQAILAHMEAQDAQKKSGSSTANSTSTSAS